MRGTLGILDKEDYILLTNMIDVQDFLDLVNQEGVYEFYKTKKYKHLNKELLYGVYLYLLTNIKLHREYKKTKVGKATSMNNHMGRELFTCEVTLEYDVMELGKDHLHEFLGWIIREYVKYYKGWSVSTVIPEESTNARRTNLVYPPNDIIYLIVLLRGYYGRYSGQEEFDTMVISMVDEMDNTENVDVEAKGVRFNMSMMAVNLRSEIERGTWWYTKRTIKGRLTRHDYGFTGRDKSVAEWEYRKRQARNFKRHTD